MSVPGTPLRGPWAGSTVALALAVVLAIGMWAPANAQSSAQSAVLTATLQLPDGSIEYPVELGTLHVFSQSESPFLVQVIDGCAVNGHLWVLGVGFSSTPAPLKVLDATSGLSHTGVLPAYVPGEPVRPLFDARAIAACEDAPLGGLPELVGTASYIAVTDGCSGSSEPFALRSDGSEAAYRRYVRSGTGSNHVVAGKAIATIDASSSWDELHLLAESRTPRRIEGVVFAGGEGMLPAAGRLERSLKRLTPARVRRAFEAAKNGRVPRGVVDELGLKGFDCVHHVSLDLETPGAAAHLAAAGWIADAGPPEPPPTLVEERFTVDIVEADGTATRLPMVGPIEGSEDDGLLWHFQDDRAKAEVIDACDLAGSFWSLGATVTDVPVEMVVTDTRSGQTSMQVLWGEDVAPAAAADTATLTGCP